MDSLMTEREKGFSRRAYCPIAVVCIILGDTFLAISIVSSSKRQFQQLLVKLLSGCFITVSNCWWIASPFKYTLALFAWTWCVPLTRDQSTLITTILQECYNISSRKSSAPTEHTRLTMWPVFIWTGPKKHLSTSRILYPFWHHLGTIAVKIPEIITVWGVQEK